MAHIHEKIDFTVCVYIVHARKVLMHMHKKLNIWLPPGGHIELDEDPNEAAIREAKEETGLDVELVGQGKDYDSPYGSRDLILPRFLNRHHYDTTGIHEHVNLAFFARTKRSDARHEVEGGEVKWFTEKEIDDPAYNIVPDVRYHAHIALVELSE